MHPFYLNEIAARGEGNELIAATVRNSGNVSNVSNVSNGRSLMDEGKFYS